jgi:hypothetical protein
MAVRTMTSVYMLAMGIARDLRALTSVLVLVGEELGDLVTDLTVRKLDIVLGGAVVRHEGEEAIVGHIQLVAGLVTHPVGCMWATYELIFLAADVGDVHVVGGRAKLLQLLAGEDVDGD